MKTIKEKAKAYDDALKRARALNNGEDVDVEAGTTACEYIFPELKESEDERIKKDLIEWFEEFPDTIWRGHYKKDVLAWLEMQGEQTNVELGQSEVTQTSDQELELKFHPGDWIINNEYGDVLKVTKADAKGYEITNQDEEIFNILKEDVECNFRLWTIADAKDGDLIYVSTDKKGIQAIFHEYKNDTIFLHCYLCADFVQGGYMPIGSVELTYPLQKTHYNSFFEKMHKAGYKWDNEKKELRKVEPNLVDNVETKFKVGQWFVNNITNDAFLIKSINNGYYTLEDIKGNIISPCLPPCGNDSHLWTIADAKDGDVLVDVYGNIGIFDKCYDFNWKSYCSLEKYGGFQYFIVEHENENTHPATKEQIELLFQKMKEAGWEWDAEKKEANKIEVKKLDANKVVEWMKNKFSAPDMIIEQLKEDFEL